MILFVNKIKLRPLQDSDLDFLFQLENDMKSRHFSRLSNELYSKRTLKNYISNASEDISIAKQFRFVIDIENNPVGCADLFNYSLSFSEVEVGIGVLKNHRRKGYARDALKLLIEYAFNVLKVDKIHSKIHDENTSSIFLFKKLGFNYTSSNKYILNKCDY